MAVCKPFPVHESSTVFLHVPQAFALLLLGALVSRLVGSADNPVWHWAVKSDVLIDGCGSRAPVPLVNITQMNPNDQMSIGMFTYPFVG